MTHIVRGLDLKEISAEIVEAVNDCGDNYEAREQTETILKKLISSTGVIPAESVNPDLLNTFDQIDWNLAQNKADHKEYIGDQPLVGWYRGILSGYGVTLSEGERGPLGKKIQFRVTEGIRGTSKVFVWCREGNALVFYHDNKYLNQ